MFMDLRRLIRHHEAMLLLVIPELRGKDHLRGHGQPIKRRPDFSEEVLFVLICRCGFVIRTRTRTLRTPSPLLRCPLARLLDTIIGGEQARTQGDALRLHWSRARLGIVVAFPHIATRERRSGRQAPTQSDSPSR